MKSKQQSNLNSQNVYELGNVTANVNPLIAAAMPADMIM
jgi:hypothetical protein